MNATTEPERWVTFETAAHLLGFRRTDDLYMWLCARGIRFDGKRRMVTEALLRNLGAIK